MRNAEIADRPGRAGRPLRARRRGRLPGRRLPQAARSVRDSPRSVEPARGARAGPPSCRTSARRSRRRSRRCSRPARSRQAVKLREKFPGELVRFMRHPGPGPEDRAQDPRRARHRDPRRAARGGRGRSGCARSPGSGPKAEQNILAALDRIADGGPRGAPPAAVGGAGDRRADRRGAARAPRRGPGRDRRQRAAHDRHLQGPRRDRDRPRRRRADRGVRRARRDRRGARRAARRARGSSPTTGSRSTSAWSRRTSSGTCSST